MHFYTYDSSTLGYIAVAIAVELIESSLQLWLHLQNIITIPYRIQQVKWLPVATCLVLGAMHQFVEKFASIAREIYIFKYTFGSTKLPQFPNRTEMIFLHAISWPKPCHGKSANKISTNHWFAYLFSPSFASDSLIYLSQPLFISI